MDNSILCVSRGLLNNGERALIHAPVLGCSLDPIALHETIDRVGKVIVFSG
eukprot:m.69467 g.69467  ORF g.69467 m.69467 type:complete len:51 (+) comp13737_c0_seq1:400-552(+)